MTKILWLDTETTGLDPVRNDIVQLSGILVQDGAVLTEFNYQCQPLSWENIIPEALRVQNRTVEDLQGFGKPTEMYARLISEVLEKHIGARSFNRCYLGGYNTAFDYAFLKQFFIKMGEPDLLDRYANYQLLDAMQMALALKLMGKIKPSNLKLTSLAKYCGVALDNAHDALADIRATREVYRILSKKCCTGAL